MESDNAPTEAQVRASEFRRTRMARKAKALSTQLTLEMFAKVMNESSQEPDLLHMGLDSGTEFLKSINKKRWPSGIISDTNVPGERVIRSLGLSFIDVSEIVIRFKVDESDAALGIYNDLVNMALQDPEEARGKIHPGRNVIAFRFGRIYSMHCALGKCQCVTCALNVADDASVTPNSSPLWGVLSELVPHFRAVQIVLKSANPEAAPPPGGVRCSACSTVLSAQHKCCPCKAVAYCGRECQVKHWRLHKMMCAHHASIDAQLRSGEATVGGGLD